MSTALRLSSGPSERAALAELAGRCVSASGDRAVSAALQIMRDGVSEDLCSTCVVLVEKIATDGVEVDRGGSFVVLHLQISAHGVSSASRCLPKDSAIQGPGLAPARIEASAR